MLPRTMRERSQGLVLALAVIGAIALVAGAAVGLASPAGDSPRPSAPAVPHVNHVFIIVLENENADSTFGKHTAAPYLARQLRGQGAFLPNYYAIGHESLDNYIAMVSGQAPNTRPRPIARSIPTSSPGRRPRTASTAAPGACTRRRWRRRQPARGLRLHLEGLHGGHEREGAAGRGHPLPSSRAQPQDDTQTAEVGDQYAARHNPFVYFHAIIDSPPAPRTTSTTRTCARPADRGRRPPNYSFITPNLCHDGHDRRASTASPAGSTTANKWLRSHMPADPSLARVRAPGPSDRHLRRGRGATGAGRRFERLLQRAARAQRRPTIRGP